MILRDRTTEQRIKKNVEDISVMISATVKAFV